MDEKIKEVNFKLLQLKEKPTGYEIDGQPIMKGSSLTLNVIEGEFDPQFFEPKEFAPMIEVLVNETDQVEHTKIITPPLNMTPVWKEILPFDITRPTDEVAI